MNRPKVGIGVLIFNKDRLLLGNRQQNQGTNSWGPPGGHLEFGETFEQCALREVKEEIGLTISQPTFIAVTNDIFTEEKTHYVSIFFSARYPVDQPIQNLEPHKAALWQWFSIDALPDALFLPLKNLLQTKGKEFLFNLANRNS